MPEFTIQLPDGSTLDVEANSENDALIGAQRWYAAQGSQPAVTPPAPEPAQPAYRGDGSEEAAAYGDPRAMGHIPAGEDANVADVAQQFGKGFFHSYDDELAALAGSLPHVLTGGRHGRSREEILREVRARQSNFEAERPGLATASELAGGVTGALGTGTLALRAAGAAPTVGRAALAGGALAAPGGALDATGRIEGPASAGTYAGEAAEGAAISGTLGAALGGGGNALARALNPIASQLAEALTRRGVHLTPGEVMGPGVTQKLEDIGATLPVIGPMIRARADEGVNSLNTAASREVLEPLGPRAGERYMRGVEPGIDAQRRLRDVFNRRYGRVVPRLSAEPDAQFAREVAQIAANLPPAVRPQFAEAVQHYVQRTVDPATGRISGEQLQGSLEALRTVGRSMRNSQIDPFHADLGNAMGSLRHSLIASAERHSAPRDVAEFQRIQRAYRRYRPVRDAASGVASDSGVFSPARLHSSVRAADESAGKGATARGETVMQDLSGPARAVMKPKGGGSPTAERAAYVGAGGTGAALLTGAMEPTTALAAAVPASLIAGLYTRRGNRAFQRYATGPRRAARDRWMTRTMLGSSLPGELLEHQGE